MKSLIIYDLTGKIWLIAHGEKEAPQGVLCMFVDIPDGAILTKIDVTDIDNPQPVFEYLPDTDIGRLQNAVKVLEEENTSLKQNAEVNLLAIGFVAETFTDEQALKVPTLYEHWNGESVSYKTGKRIRYNDVLYKVIVDHISQPDWIPESAHSLYAKILIEDPNAIVEWVQPDSTNGYMIGDKVIFDGITYESQVDNNIWKPDEVGENIWKVVIE